MNGGFGHEVRDDLLDGRDISQICGRLYFKRLLVLRHMVEDRDEWDVGNYISSTVAFRATVVCFTSGRYHILSFRKYASFVASTRILGSWLGTQISV